MDDMLTFRIEKDGRPKHPWCIAIYQDGVRVGELCRAISKEVAEMAFNSFKECANKAIAEHMN